MTSQYEITSEQKKVKKALRLLHALDWGLSEALQSDGNELKALALTINPGVCRMVIKAVVDGVHSVGFVYSDSAPGCILKAAAEVKNGRLVWGVDSYHQK